MSKKKYTGINIQAPISRHIISGEKTIETRTYPLPEKYLNQEMLLIETPGSSNDFKSRIIAIIKFTECFKYESKEKFYKDINKHLVSKDSPWAWKDKAKYGWKVEIIKSFPLPKIVTSQKGIIYTKDLSL
jgi:hypothetical protein